MTRNLGNHVLCERHGSNSHCEYYFLLDDMTIKLFVQGDITILLQSSHMACLNMDMTCYSGRVFHRRDEDILSEGKNDFTVVEFSAGIGNEWRIVRQCLNIGK